MRFIFFLSAVLSCLCVYSQGGYTVSGKVVSKADKENLPFIHISIQDTLPGTVTGEKGTFTLSGVPQGRHLLRIYGTGYSPLQAEIEVKGHVADLVFGLEETAFELEPVVVTAARTRQLLKDVPIAVQVLSGRSLEKMQVSNFRDMLEYELPGIEFTHNGGYANINMLGFGGKYVLFLVDGERLSGESFDNIDYNRIDMDYIERIEIIKGASSSLYGSNAVGGVINIITRKPQEKIELRANARYGSYEEQYLNLSVASKQKWGSFILSGSYKHEDPFLFTDRSPETREFANGAVQQLALNETYIAGFKEHAIRPKVTFNLSPKAELELRGGYFFKERHPGGRSGEKVRGYFYDYTGGGKLSYTFSEKQHLVLSGNYDRYDKSDYYKILGEKEKKYENSQLRFSALYDFSLFDTHLIVSGVEYFSDDLMTYMFEDGRTDTHRDVHTVSVFSQQDWKLSPQLTMVSGLRYDYHSRFKGHLTPRLSFMYRPFARWTFRGGYAGGFRSPTLKELYTDWYHPDGGGFQILGNRDMQPEISHNFNLSAEGSYAETQITAMAQYSLIDDKVDLVWLGTDTVRYLNRGERRVFSTEVSISRRLGTCLSLCGAYAYVHDGMKKSSVTRPHTATFRADYTFSFLKKYVPVLSLSGKFFSGMNVYSSTTGSSETDSETGITKETTDEYKVHYEPYSIWRLTASVPLPWNFGLYAGINNLFDYQSPFASFYSSITPGRTYYIGLKWKLN